jgi:hypothetical protein
LEGDSEEFFVGDGLEGALEGKVETCAARQRSS